jgi:hypothetical protein
MVGDTGALEHACPLAAGGAVWGLVLVVEELRARNIPGLLIEEGHHGGVTSQDRLTAAQGLLV